MRSALCLVFAAGLALVATGCGSDNGDESASTDTVTVVETVTVAEPTEVPPGVCSNDDGALEAAFVFVETPSSGERVEPGFTVAGCSRTFESTFLWRLLDRDGAELAGDFAMGGGVDGPGDFEFEVDYTVAELQIGHLEVFEEDVSEGEGFPPPRNVIPLVLLP